MTDATDLIARMEALEKVLPAAVLDLIQTDPHQWSTRPCPTCRAITAIVGRRFGCDRYRQERHEAALRARAEQPTAEI